MITGREDSMKVLSRHQRAWRHALFRHRLCCVNILLLTLLVMAVLLIFSGRFSPLLGRENANLHDGHLRISWGKGF
ncbi:hypothetical protein KPO98_004064 [Salmonella enterica]|nr:hypothetical protein [Salmonella enterica]